MIREKHVMNSLLDGSDCVMLSGETAKGDYPVQCIKTMSALTQEAEACLWNERFFEEQLKQVSWARRLWGHSELFLRYSFGNSSEKIGPIL
jgi:pyruvate kinase